MNSPLPQLSKNDEPTVQIDYLEGYHALKMTWQHNVQTQDVYTAFHKIEMELRKSDQPLYVVVDLLSDPRFPLKATVDGARVSYRHPRLAEWLIIGSNWLARAIERALASVTNKRNVRWFDSEDAALAYLEKLKRS
ncbi:MAG: STAS/SEC14 domain-containing protein [Anaerolineae bacterium]|nr:STAS/SEC14 domain-containing protein [Anaerolineae bacterium]